MKKLRQGGFTLIEVTIVLGLIGVIAAFGVAMSYSSLSKTNVTQERDLFVALLLRSTRAAAIANIDETAHGVKFDNSGHRYILFDGADPNAAAANPRYIPYTNENINVTNTGGDTIVFAQLSSDVTFGSGTVSISNGVTSQAVNIRSTGQIDW